MEGENGPAKAALDRRGILERLHPEYIAIGAVFLLVWLHAFGVFS